MLENMFSLIAMSIVYATVGLVSWILSKTLDEKITFSLKNVSVLLFINLWFAINIWLWFWPMNRVRDLCDVGFRHLGRRRRVVSRSRRLKKPGNPPPPFPNGWFVLLESRDLQRGEVKQVDALGLNLAVYRSSDADTVFVTDAYCPHLGANIAVGGRVTGDCIQCPFHNWSYCGETGQCVDVPYSSASIPEQARLRVWTCVERNGLVLLWHHADGLPPSWDPPVIDEVEDGDWVYQGRNEFIVNCHIQDIPENGADVAHLDAVHSASIILGGEPTHQQEKNMINITCHKWNAKWKAGSGEEKHTATIELEHKKILMGSATIFSLDVKAVQIGPAIVHLNFQSLFGPGVMIQYVLPLETNVQKLVHVFYTCRSWIAPYAKLVLLGESILVERDIRVWNNKTYVDKPVFIKEDKLVSQHRKWYSQFYSEGSRNLGQQKSLQW